MQQCTESNVATQNGIRTHVLKWHHDTDFRCISRMTKGIFFVVNYEIKKQIFILI